MTLLTKRDYLREHGLENAPVDWQIKTYLDHTRHNGGSLGPLRRVPPIKPRPPVKAKPKPKPTERAGHSNNLGNLPVPDSNLAPVPTPATATIIDLQNRLGLFIAAALERILEFNLSPTQIQAGSRMVTDQFASTYGRKPTLAQIRVSMPRAFDRLSRKYAREPLARAAQFLLDDLEARLGLEGVGISRFPKRDYWAELKQLRKGFSRRSTNGSAAELLQVLNARNKPMRLGQDRRPVRELVRKSVGLEEKGQDFRPLNPDRQLAYSIVEKPNGIRMYRVSDGVEFPNLESTLQYITATQNSEPKKPARVL